MAEVFISIGSNIDKEQNIMSGLVRLEQQFGPLKQSSIYESDAVGFEGPSFYNLVATFATNYTPYELVDELKKIEFLHGKPENSPSFTPRTLDIDLLLYDDLTLFNHRVELPRSDIIKYAFVLKPLAEIAGHKIHPLLSKSYQELWDHYDKSFIPLKMVESIAR